MSNSSEESAAPKKLERVIVENTGALSPQDSVQTAGDRMRSVEANAWPVADGGKLVGVIDQPDPDRQAGGHGHDPQTTRVGETMRHDAVYCYEDQDAAEADRIMEEHHLKHLPVVNREMHIVGIISRSDVQGEAAKADAQEPVEDWKPGESHRSARHSRYREHSEPPEEEGGSGGGSEESGLAAHARFHGEDTDDAERFPFRVPAEGAGTDERP